MVTFFKEAQKRKRNPAIALAACYWDLATLPVQPYDAAKASAFLTGLMEQRAHGAQRELLKVFANEQHDRATDVLAELEWRVWQDDRVWEEEIFDQVLSDIGHAPEESTVFLVTANDDLSDVVTEARRRGARVYAVTPAPTVFNPRGARLVEAAGKRRHIVLSAESLISGFVSPIPVR